MLTRYLPINGMMREATRESDAVAEREPAARRFTRADLASLWLELNVSEQCATGNGGALLPRYADGPEGWFRAHELGFHFGNADKDIVQTAQTLRSDNAKRRAELKRLAEDLVRRFQADADRLGMKARVPKIEEPSGCGGCSSCVPETRSRPRRSAEPKRARNYVPTRRGWALSETIADERRERHAAETAQLAERRRRRHTAREQMNSRRSEQEVVRRAARRGLVEVIGTVTEE